MRTDTTAAVLRFVALVAAVAVLATGCTSKEDLVTPEEARDSLVTVTSETAALVESVGAWSPSGDPSAGSCNGGLNWDYGISAPPPDSARLEDAQTVADYWTSLGMEVRVQTDPDPVVYATGGPLKGISFSTGPGLYSIGGTSMCAPGDPDDYR